jgi:hypothetical protein
MNQPSLPRNHQLNKPNLQEPKKNDDGTNSIPTIVNGVTSVDYNAMSEHKYSDSIENSINELRQSINPYNKGEHALSKKHRVILIGDSHVKVYGCNLKLLLSKNYELYSVAKPGSSSSELKETAKEEISQLSHEDVIVICCGSNDCELNEFSLTLQNIKNFIQTNKHTNIILINVPLRYDLRNSTSVNRSISILNRKLKKLVKVYPHTNFLETDNNRISFINHGLHLNKSGKRLVAYQLASFLQSVFEQKTSAHIILGWHNEIQVNNIPICQGNQVKLSIRNSTRNKKNTNTWIK